MKTPAILLIASLAATATAIDFTPQTTDSIDDGVPMRRMYFSDGTQPIYYRPPAGWTCSGDAQAATLKPKAPGKGSIRILNGAAEYARIPFDEPGLEALRKIARTRLPSDATEVTGIWEIVNPVVLQGWTSFEAGFDYIQSGQRYCRSVLLINLDARRQVHFVVEAPPSEFDPLYKGLYRSLATWWQPTDTAAR